MVIALTSAPIFDAIDINIILEASIEMKSSGNSDISSTSNDSSSLNSDSPETLSNSCDFISPLIAVITPALFSTLSIYENSNVLLGSNEEPHNKKYSITYIGGTFDLNKIVFWSTIM